MTLHVHHVRGCAPAPLAHYLKALGILRVLATQRDGEARGCWRDQHFVLLSVLDAAALEDFFLREYAPTPLLSPWNKGSGFYSDRDEAGRALAALDRSVAPRFAPYRDGIATSRAQLDAIARADAEVRRLKEMTKGRSGNRSLRDQPEYRAQLAAAEREFKRLKADLYAPFARHWRAGLRDWMDAAMVLGEEGKPHWPSLLGTGGNDGRLDFTNNAMQRLGQLFDLTSSDGAPRGHARDALRAALWSAPTRELVGAAIGQYLPGSAGGANATTGPDGAPLVNPWDFVLMLEGTLAFRGQVTKRLGVSGARGAVPFAVQAHAAGHATPGREKAERGEQWLPLWSAPAALDDVTSLYAEGRAQTGRTTASQPVDFARAVARLGVARGLSAFVRYGYLERNGQSKIAVPLGRVDVVERPRARLVDDIAPWLEALQRMVRKGDAPIRVSSAEAALAAAVFAVLSHDDAPSRWQAVLHAVVAVEQLQATGAALRAGPCPPLSPEWLEAADDGSAEWRLAVALGGASDREDGRRCDAVRHHALPLDARGRFVTSDHRLVKSPRVVMQGRDPLDDLVALVERRLIEAARRGKRHLTLVAPSDRGAAPLDLAAWLSGSLDAERVVSLARALMAIRWNDVPSSRSADAAGVRELDEGWIALRLVGLPFPVRERRAPIELAMLRRLASGDGGEAIAGAVQRLEVAGYRSPIRAAFASDPRRWAAALAFPIEPTVALAMARRFDPPQRTETR